MFDTLSNLQSQWTTTRRNTTLPFRVAMRSIEVFAMVIAFLVIPSFIQEVVSCIDETYELMGRRARSKFSAIPWIRIIIGAVFLIAWNIWLVRLSYVAIIEEEDEEEVEESGSKSTEDTYDKNDERKEVRTISKREKNQKKRKSWGRILSRTIIPGLLIFYVPYWSLALAIRFIFPVPLMVENAIAQDEVRVDGIR